jgi:hypothetical protein
MIEQGLSLLIQADPTVRALCPEGGFMSILPEGQRLPAWTYFVVSDPGHYVLDQVNKFGDARIQIDCYGNTAAEAMALATAIDDVLSGYKGVLADADATRVAGAFRNNKIDFFDDASRTYRRLLEYTVWSYD